MSTTHTPTPAATLTCKRCFGAGKVSEFREVWQSFTVYLNDQGDPCGAGDHCHAKRETYRTGRLEMHVGPCHQCGGSGKVAAA